MAQPLTPKKLKLNSSTKTYKIFGTNSNKKDVLFIIEDWNAKVDNQKIPGATDKLGLEVHNKAGFLLQQYKEYRSTKNLKRLLPRKHTGHNKPLFQ